MRINRNIIASHVRVTRDGENLGVMPVYQAQDLAMREDLDLVEISPNSKPPVCAIMDFGKWKFSEKQKNKQQKSIQPKEIRLRPVTSDHDVDVKIQQLKKFLLEKRSVSVNIKFKNREIIHKDNGRRIIEKIVNAVTDVGKPENNPKFEGFTLSVRFVPKA